MDNTGDFLKENQGKELNNPAVELQDNDLSAFENLELVTKSDSNDLHLRNLRTDLENEYKIIAKVLQSEVVDKFPLEKSEAKFKPLLEIGFGKTINFPGVSAYVEEPDQCNGTAAINSSFSATDIQQKWLSVSDPSSKTTTSEPHQSIGALAVKSGKEDSADELQENFIKSAAKALQEKTCDQFKSNDGRLTGQFFREVSAAEATEGQVKLPGIYSHEENINGNLQSNGKWLCEYFQGLDVNECAHNKQILKGESLDISNLGKKKYNEELVKTNILYKVFIGEDTKKNEKAITALLQEASKEKPIRTEENQTTWVESLCGEAFDEFFQIRTSAAKSSSQDRVLARTKFMLDKSSGKRVQFYDDLSDNVLEEVEFAVTSCDGVTTTHLTYQNNELTKSIFQEKSGLERSQHDLSLKILHQNVATVKTPEQERIADFKGTQLELVEQSELQQENSDVEKQYSVGASEEKRSYLGEEYHEQYWHQHKIHLSMEDNFSASWQECDSIVAKQRSSGAENVKEGYVHVDGSLSDFENGSVEVLDIVEICNCDSCEQNCKSVIKYMKS